MKAFQKIRESIVFIRNIKFPSNESAVIAGFLVPPFFAAAELQKRFQFSMEIRNFLFLVLGGIIFSAVWGIPIQNGFAVLKRIPFMIAGLLASLVIYLMIYTVGLLMVLGAITILRTAGVGG